MGQAKYKNGFKVTLHEDTLALPLSWKKPRQIFVNSMGDLFHKDVPIEFIRKVFKTMERANWHVYQLLTKRSERMLSLAPKLPWPENVWMGVTCETSDYIYRMQHLQQVPSAIRFVSMEPLLGPIGNFPVKNIDWIILGGESGPGARPMDKRWVIEIKDRCNKYSIPFFFKQWGGTRRQENGCLLDGMLYQETPSYSKPEISYSLPLK